MSDQADIDAERLPKWIGHLTDPVEIESYKSVRVGCQCYPTANKTLHLCDMHVAIAAALRELHEDVAIYKRYWENTGKELAAAKAEIAVRDNQITQLLETNDKQVIEIERLRNAPHQPSADKTE